MAINIYNFSNPLTIHQPTVKNLRIKLRSDRHSAIFLLYKLTQRIK